ncbi:hypothetical protein HZA33_05410 [Candidatus Pacearchaeota archaeon]|nr:hypothetical protein [Candidatus Pacearchaeota archaeon]
MTDIFENTILCNECNCKMQRIQLEKNGFLLRAVQCPKCEKRIVHPHDEQEYKQFIELRNRSFSVKLRMVGNSYTVSIPREIVNFIKEQERIMSDMVKLCFEEAGKLSLEFEEHTKNLNNKLDKIKGKI